MQLTILGCYGPYPPAGGACSGYLLQEEGCSILLDCGNGVLSRLQQFLKFEDLDAVFLSHLHADHMSDIMIMRYGLELAYNQGRRSEPLPLYAPAEPASEFERLPYKNAYALNPLKDGQKMRIGPFSLEFGEGVHAVPSMAMRIQSSIGSVVYSGDTEYNRGLEKLASGADLLLCEANYLKADLENGLPNHLSSAQAAQIAASAGVKRLVLTHHYPGRDRKETLSEAAEHFSAVTLAREGEVIIL
jgi:ribonuclease BN (tRNA processing enzyme)